MNKIILTMNIKMKIVQFYLIEIKNENLSTEILFDPINKLLEFKYNDELTIFLKRNEYQLRKILHNKRHDTFYPNFQLKFVLTEDKDIKAFNDRANIVVLDKRDGKNLSYVIENHDKPITKIYTDASFLENIGRGGIAIIFENLKGDYKLFTESVDFKSSNLLELMAVAKGLEILEEIKEIRIITDSQYVRKGLTEWIYNWELNDWYTANGEKAKHIELWQKVNNLTNEKYIEFEWVKAHNNHFENTICDLYAKEAAKNNKR